MPILLRSDFNDFLERFNSFNDAVLRKIAISYTSDGSRNVVIWMASRDAQQKENEGWTCVRLTISYVQDFCFSDLANTSHQVLSNGIHIVWSEKIIGLDFGWFVDSPDTIVDLKASRFFATGTSVDWAVEPY